MLGNNVSAESLSALGGKESQDENDALESAEHARLLVEDCRRMLLGTALLPIGAWGLIDADPSSGDPNETEVDSILLLTNEEYIVADYDSHLDKIVRFENVPLKNMSMVEFGLFQQTHNMFKGPAPAHLCIRLNYSIDGVEGYFHMFRSPSIRFFNNVAVVIKKNEELVESMTAIVEFFKIALESSGNSDVPFICGGTLQRRKSRAMLQPPAGIPRNLSESQLVQIGSKALSNVAGQFSKLGQSLNPSKSKKPNANPPVAYNSTQQDASSFYVGREAKEKNDGDTSDSDDNDCSIYEPDLMDSVEQNPIYNENAFLPSVGIVMGSGAGGHEQEHSGMLENKESNLKIASDISTVSISSIANNIQMPKGMLLSPTRSLAPEIRISGSLSHSANEMKNAGCSNERPDRDLTLTLSGSQSENAIKQLKTLASPLTMFAKGVQSLGVNLGSAPKVNMN